MSDDVTRAILRLEGIGHGSEWSPARASAYVLSFDGEKFNFTGVIDEVLHVGNPLPPFAFVWVQKVRGRWFITWPED